MAENITQVNFETDRFVFHLGTESNCSPREVFQSNVLLAINFQTISTDVISTILCLQSVLAVTTKLN